MARRVNFFEPWTASQSTTWESSFRHPPAVDDPDVRAQWEAAKDRAKRNAEWQVWGTGVWEPSVCWSLGGQMSVHEGTSILGSFRPYNSDKEGAPSHGEVAKRVAACVSACAGMVNPIDTIARCRSLLGDLLSGKAGLDDPRILQCAARFLKPDTLDTPREDHS